MGGGYTHNYAYNGTYKERYTNTYTKIHTRSKIHNTYYNIRIYVNIHIQIGKIYSGVPCMMASPVPRGGAIIYINKCICTVYVLNHECSNATQKESFAVTQRHTHTTHACICIMSRRYRRPARLSSVFIAASISRTINSLDSSLVGSPRLRSVCNNITERRIQSWRVVAIIKAANNSE